MCAWYGKHECVGICSQGWHGCLQTPADFPNLHAGLNSQDPRRLTQVHILLDIFTHVSCELRLVALADQLDVERSPLKQRLLTTLNLQVELNPVLPVAPQQQVYGCFSYLVQLHFLN